MAGADRVRQTLLKDRNESVPARLSGLQKCEQIGVDLIRMDLTHAVREPRIYLQFGVLHDLRRHETSRPDGNDLNTSPTT